MNRSEPAIVKANVGKSLVKLFSGEISEQEAIAIHSNLDQDPTFREDFSATTSVLADMADLATDEQILAIANEPRYRLTENIRNYWRPLSVAAGLILAIAVGFTAFLPKGAEDHGVGSQYVQRYATYVGEQRTINLPDGSTITLNTASQLLVDLANNARRLTLERGEAFFDVKSDPERPFIVDVGERSVTVLGTKFSVFKLPEKYRIAVTEGVVAFHKIQEIASPGAPILTSPDGEEVEIASPSQRRVQAGWVAEFDVVHNTMSGYAPTNIDGLHAWRTGLIEFYKEPLYKVVRELNRYTKKKILIEDSTIMDLSVYAGVDIKKIDATLIGLEQLLPIKVNTYFDRIVIVASGSNG